MKRTTKYVFVDVHQATTFAVVREENGRILAHPVLPTEAHALVEFVGGQAGQPAGGVRGRHADAVAARVAESAGGPGDCVRSRIDGRVGA